MYRAKILVGGVFHAARGSLSNGALPLRAVACTQSQRMIVTAGSGQNQLQPDVASPKSNILPRRQLPQDQIDRHVKSSGKISVICLRTGICNYQFVPCLISQTPVHGLVCNGSRILALYWQVSRSLSFHDPKRLRLYSTLRQSCMAIRSFIVSTWT